MRSSFCLVLFSILISASAHAQTASTPLESPRAGDEFFRSTYFGVGLNVGLTSGVGLSGRISLPGGAGFQLTTGVITAFDYLHYNFGIEAQYAFDRYDNGRFYGLATFGYFNSQRQDSAEKYPGNRIAEPVRFGLGLGYDIFLSQRAVISLSIPITVFAGGSSTKILPIPQAGFFYYFR